VRLVGYQNEIFSSVLCTFSSKCNLSLHQQHQDEMSNKEMFLVLKLFNTAGRLAYLTVFVENTPISASSLLHFKLETQPISDT
jgi:hypothetical protein